MLVFATFQCLFLELRVSYAYLYIRSKVLNAKAHNLYSIDLCLINHSSDNVKEPDSVSGLILIFTHVSTREILLDEDECLLKKLQCPKHNHCFNTKGGAKCVNFKCPDDYAEVRHGYALKLSSYRWLSVTHLNDFNVFWLSFRSEK